MVQRRDEMKGFLLFKAAAWLLPWQQGGGSSTAVRLRRGEGTGQGSGLARFGPSREDSGSRTRGGAEQGRRRRGRGAGVGSQVAGELGLQWRARARRGHGAGRRGRHGGGVKVQPWVKGRDGNARRGQNELKRIEDARRIVATPWLGWSVFRGMLARAGPARIEMRCIGNATRAERSVRASSATRPLRGGDEGSGARARTTS